MSNAPVLDADGKAIIEEKEIRIPMFKVVSVFDVSQTAGKPLPQLAADLSGNVPVSYTHLDVYKRQRLERIETDLLNNFKRLGVVAAPLNGFERLHVCLLYTSEYGESRKKVSDELYISPRYLANIENKGQQPSLQVFLSLIHI